MTATSPAFIGNTRARHLLDVAIQGERAHAILLTGPAGLGKRTLARLALAQAAGRPVQAADPDVLDLSRDPGALGGPGGIGREVAVRIVKHLSRRPVASPRSCVLLPGADRLTPEAANALLVTLEEPPAHALILLTATNAGAVLPTVRSRCLPIPLQLVSAAEIKAGLGAPNPVVALAAGRPGRALRYLHDQALPSSSMRSAATCRPGRRVTCRAGCSSPRATVPSGRRPAPSSARLIWPSRSAGAAACSMPVAGWPATCSLARCSRRLLCCRCEATSRTPFALAVATLTVATLASCASSTDAGIFRSSDAGGSYISASTLDLKNPLPTPR
ncbi:MAG: hypothetical protein U0514_01780 [Candidatus Andersenbacteria bacterium]